MPALPSTLTYLDCSVNQIPALPALPPAIQILYCDENQISVLPVLPVSLVLLRCPGNNLTSIPTLSPDMVFLSCGNNPIPILPTLPMKIRQLGCDNCLLTSLPTLPDSLLYLSCSVNQLTLLPVLPTKLKELNCAYNQLTSIPTIKDTLDNLIINDNPDLRCLPPVRRINGSFLWSNAGIKCFPNTISAYQPFPSLAGVPICGNDYINGTTGFCRASSGNIYTTGPQTSANSYNWTVPNGGTITSGQNTSTVTVSYSGNATSGNICVVTNGCAGAVTTCKALIQRASNPTTPRPIIGSTNGCIYENKRYSILKAANTDSYIWIPPAGATINGSSSAFATADTFVNVAYSATFTGDTLRVRSVNCKGISAERKLRINHNPAAMPGAITGAKSGLCNKTHVSYSINPVTDAYLFTWRTNIPGATINGSSSPVSSTYLSMYADFGTFSTGQIYVKASNNCGSSAERALTVDAKPASPSIITGPVSVCDGQSGVQYTTPVVTNALTYNWTVPSGASIASGQNTTNITVNFGSTVLTSNVRVQTQNACGSSAYLRKSVTINNCPRIGEEIQSDLNIYPNPFTETAIIEIPVDAVLSTCKLQIIDITGKIVRSVNEISDYTLTIEKETLSPGLYYLQLFAGDKNYSVKVMLQ